MIQFEKWLHERDEICLERLQKELPGEERVRGDVEDLAVAESAAEGHDHCKRVVHLAGYEKRGN